jgi:hypothetical protein
MSSPLAAYQVKVPKIVWTPEQPGLDAVYTDDFTGYASTAEMLAVWTFLVNAFPGATCVLDPTGSESGGPAMRIDVPGGTQLGHTGAYAQLDMPGLLYQQQTLRVHLKLDPEFLTDDRWDRYDIGAFQPGGSIIGAARTDAWQTITVHDVPRYDSNTTFRAAVGWAFLAYYTTTADTSIWIDLVELLQPATTPIITNTLEFGYPLRQARSWTAPSEGSDRVRYPSGEERAWIDEEDGLLEGTVFHIPAEDDETSFAPISGWNGAAGWQAFLEYAWAGNPFAFWRNRAVSGSALTCQLLAPRDPPQPGPAGTRRLTLRLRTTNTGRFGGY